MFKNNVCTFLKNSAYLKDEYIIYLYNTNNCLLETKYNEQKFYNNFNLSNEIKKILKNTETTYINNNIFINLSENDEKQKYCGFMINKINNNHFLIIANQKLSINESYKKFNKTTIFFLREMLKDSKY